MVWSIPSVIAVRFAMRLASLVIELMVLGVGLNEAGVCESDSFLLAL